MRVPFVDPGAAELLFRHQVLSFLKAEGLLSHERAARLLSWKHRTGFPVDTSVRVEPEDRAGLERLAVYILRQPVSLERMRWDGGAEDPLTCAKCDGEMRIISVKLDTAVITTILEHVRKKRETDSRAPPHATGSREAAS